MSSPKRCGSATSAASAASAGSECTRCTSWCEIEKLFPEQVSELPPIDTDQVSELPPIDTDQVSELPPIDPEQDSAFYQVGTPSPVDNLPDNSSKDDSDSGYTTPAGNLSEDDSDYDTPRVYKMPQEEEDLILCAPPRKKRKI
jgi:hypothetical protein